MRYRKLDQNGDRVFGSGLSAFWIDVPDAPAQAVLTRLQLYLGEWWLDTSDGTPWRTKVLGKFTGSTRDVVIRQRVLNTPEITAINNYSSNLNRDTRAFTVNMELDTAYGGNFTLQIPLAPVPMKLVNPPTPQLTPLGTQSGTPLTTQSGGALQAQR